MMKNMEKIELWRTYTVEPYRDYCIGSLKKCINVGRELGSRQRGNRVGERLKRIIRIRMTTIHA